RGGRPGSPAAARPRARRGGCWRRAAPPPRARPGRRRPLPPGGSWPTCRGPRTPWPGPSRRPARPATRRTPGGPARRPGAPARRRDPAWRELDDLLRASDVVSVHVPLTDETRHLVDAERLALVPEGAIVVTAARGAVIDEAALIAALESGRLGGAGLDVFE